jgi:outer membrane protein OmpA-like peptidoglycan-associated protein/Tol biopolymer transport system component
MKKLFVILQLVVALSAFGQGQRTVNQSDLALKKGKEFYDDDKYADAIPYLEQALQSNPESAEILYKLGMSYRYTEKYDEAIIHFTKLESIDEDYSPWSYYEIAMAYQRSGKSDQAINSLNKFLDKYPNDATHTKFYQMGQYRLHYVREQQNLLKAPNTMKEPVKVSLTSNSPSDDYMPMLNPTGTKLYFTSQRLGGISSEAATEKEGDEDIYVIEKSGSSWTDPTLLPEPINSSNHEGAACFSADGQVMVYTACGREGGVGSCDLYISTLDGDQWSKPINMGNVVNSKKWDSQPTLSFDGSKIIFASTREGGYGDEDIYMIEKNIFGEWGPAMNLGPAVNTPFSDFSPFLSQDGKTLYFSSEGHPGYGGYDLFKTVLENGKWSVPANLGKPLNTAGDDRYFTIGGSGEMGYFASNRGGDNMDLYSIEIPEDMRPQPTVVVSGVVTSEKTKAKIGAYVLVEDLNTGELIAVNKSNSLTGKYLVVLPAGRSYSVSANKEGFFFFSQSFEVPTTTRYQEIIKDISLKPIEKGAKIVLNNIFFETGKAALSPQSRLELSKAIDLMKTNPSMIIEVGGHTDNVGEDLSNMKLSHERAKSVRDYLVNAGITSARIQAKGYGESNPVASNETDEGRKTNRRTEFVILEF